MNNNVKIKGIHHITAIASSASENSEFYEGVLGLRLVKKTVNFDDPYTYHLYYGDSVGSPGTILTFFPWEDLPSGHAAAGMVTTVTFSIPAEAFDYWRKRLKINGIEAEETERFGDRIIRLADPHGLGLELIADRSQPSTSVWKGSPVPPENCIAGFHSATSLLPTLEETRFLLMDMMGMTLSKMEGRRYRFDVQDGDAAGQFYDVVIDPRAEFGRQGGGTVHHIAFRTPTYDQQEYWHELLLGRGFSVTPIIDRKYFKSIYFHEPGGVLFEIATDPPGFTVDEPDERLGCDLKLPDQYEPMRSEIERRLPRLQSPELSANHEQHTRLCELGSVY